MVRHDRERALHLETVKTEGLPFSAVEFETFNAGCLFDFGLVIAKRFEKELFLTLLDNGDPASCLCQEFSGAIAVGELCIRSNQEH